MSKGWATSAESRTYTRYPMPGLACSPSEGENNTVAWLGIDRRRFSRIEQELFEVKALLLQHDQVLKNHEQTLKSVLEIVKDLSTDAEKTYQKRFARKSDSDANNLRQ